MHREAQVHREARQVHRKAHQVREAQVHREAPVHREVQVHQEAHQVHQEAHEGECRHTLPSQFIYRICLLMPEHFQEVIRETWV